MLHAIGIFILFLGLKLAAVLITLLVTFLVGFYLGWRSGHMTAHFGNIAVRQFKDRALETVGSRSTKSLLSSISADDFTASDKDLLLMKLYNLTERAETAAALEERMRRKIR